jgi:hypothetical protein
MIIQLCSTLCFITPWIRYIPYTEVLYNRSHITPCYAQVFYGILGVLYNMHVLKHITPCSRQVLCIITNVLYSTRLYNRGYKGVLYNIPGMFHNIDCYTR